MAGFLQQVANHYKSEDNLERICFLFPNRRSLSFFRKYLSESVGRAMTVPPLYTINDFFFRVAGAAPTDRILLLLKLYGIYRKLNPKAESLDQFIFWGDVILGDFDDIDKYLVDPRLLLTNISDLKAIEDNYSYLTDRQREAIENFIAHFRDTSGRLTVSLDGKAEFKRRFLGIWNILYPMYQEFRETLLSEGLAYEGMVYRSFAEKVRSGSVSDILADCFPGIDSFVFVGLNALSECERTVLGKMRDAGIAQFEWDYVSRLIKDPLNKSSFFMKDNVTRFPQAFPLSDDPEHIPEIKVMSVPSSVGGVKLLPSILRSASMSNPITTAVVLPDESMLVPALNAIPEQFTDVNVTMGYPMSSSALYSLVGALTHVCLRAREKEGEWYFYHRPVRAVFSSSIFRAVVPEDESARVDTILSESKYYIPASDFAGCKVLGVIFRPCVRTIEDIEDWLLAVFSIIGSSLSVGGGLSLEVDFAKRYYTAVRLLKDYRLKDASLGSILPATWFRLLDSLARGESVPFEGEPLKGLQIMGPLETRALDFSNVVILSANEGMFPRRSISSSFIPPQLRKGFSLPTYEYQDAVWAYYFYRLIQRADRLWMIYDSRTEGLRTGEESRYIKQLRYHFDLPVETVVVSSVISPPVTVADIPKTQEHIEIIRGKELSASAIKSYLDCPAKFYYQVVEGLRAEEELSDSLDSRQIGNVFHHVMQALYLGPEAMAEDFPMSDRKRISSLRNPLKEVTRRYIEQWLGDEDALRRRIDSLIREEMNTLEVTGRNLLISDVIYQYVTRTLSRDIEQMEAFKTDRFKILGLEKEMHWEQGGFRFKGYIDRMDSFAPGTVRVVDYKTGQVEKKDVDITDANASGVVEKLFGPRNAGRPKIALQMYLYDVAVRSIPEYSDALIYNSVYAPASLFVENAPNVPVSGVFYDQVSERLKNLFSEIVDPAVPFSRCDGSDRTCEFCDFKNICGR